MYSKSRDFSKNLEVTSKLWAPEGEMKYSVHSEPTNSTRHSTKCGRAGDPALWICTLLDAKCYYFCEFIECYRWL